jgi:hypothetical protein
VPCAGHAARPGRPLPGRGISCRRGTRRGAAPSGTAAACPAGVPTRPHRHRQVWCDPKGDERPRTSRGPIAVFKIASGMSCNQAVICDDGVPAARLVSRSSRTYPVKGPADPRRCLRSVGGRSYLPAVTLSDVTRTQPRSVPHQDTSRSTQALDSCLAWAHDRLTALKIKGEAPEQTTGLHVTSSGRGSQ